MGKINFGRVVLGGLIAGLIINISEFLLNVLVLARPWADALKQLNREMPMDSGAMTLFMLLGFALGLTTIWLYAAIRPRYGAGPSTAICAGLTAWALASLYASAAMMPMHLFPRRLLLYGVLWQLFELPIAALAGAWVYREEA